MKLLGYFRSSAAYRVRIALNYKAIEYENIGISLVQGEHRSEDYLTLNPQGLVPTLVDGSNTYHQSIAIMEYLEEIHPEPALLPGDPAARASIRAMAHLIACDIHPVNNLRVLNYLKNELSVQQNEVDRWYSAWITTGFDALEKLVSKYGNDDHCFGNHLSMADIVLVPQIYNARRFKCDLSSFPRLVSIAQSLEQLAPFAAAAPEVQPDAKL